MRLLVILYLVFTPLALASVSLAGVRIEFSLVLAGFIALVWILAFLSGRVGLKRADKWSIWFWLFIAFSVISLVGSPYLPESYAKGIIQIAGMITILSASLYISRRVASDPWRLLSYVRVLAMTIALVAGIGLWQSVASNILRIDSLANFSFLNGLSGSVEVWREPGYIGSLERANSITAEPAQFAKILGMLGGIALLRLGLMGSSLSRSVATVMPRWAALLVFGGFMVGISIVGYALLGLIVISLLILLYRRDLRSFLRSAFVSVAVVALGWLLLSVLGPEFGDKVETIPLIFGGATGGTAPSESLSALSLSANLSVALDNLGSNPLFGVGPGGHPSSYDVLAPGWLISNQIVHGINREDANSLLVRLLSETGVIGTTLFLIGVLTVIVRARRAIQRALTFHLKESSRPSPILTVAIGVTASCMALFSLYLFRLGVYYDPPLWVLIALTAAVPPLLNRLYGDSIRPSSIGLPTPEAEEVRPGLRR